MPTKETTKNPVQQFSKGFPALALLCGLLLTALLTNLNSVNAQALSGSELNTPLPATEGVLHPINTPPDSQAQDAKSDSIVPIVTVSKHLEKKVPINNLSAGTPRSTTVKTSVNATRSTSMTAGTVALSTPPLTTPTAPENIVETTDSTVEGDEASAMQLPEPSINLIPDPERQPINQALDSNGLLQQNASQSLIKLMLGLAVVLSGLIGFSKLVLPKLLQNYPTFFENLKRKQTQQTEDERLDSSTTSSSLLDTIYPPAPFDWIRPTKENQSAHPPEPTASIPPQTPSLGLVRLIESQNLSPEQQLHIIEVGGRQLMIGTTPYTISLIQDLSPATSSMLPPNQLISNTNDLWSALNDGLKAREEAARLAQQYAERLEDLDDQPPSFSGFPTMANATGFENTFSSEEEPTSDAMATLKGNAYASRPGVLGQSPEALRTILKGRFTARRKQEEQTESSLESPLASFSEEPVLMADYDDKYGW